MPASPVATKVLSNTASRVVLVVSSRMTVLPPAAAVEDDAVNEESVDDDAVDDNMVDDGAPELAPVLDVADDAVPCPPPEQAANSAPNPTAPPARSACRRLRFPVKLPITGRSADFT